MNTPTIPFIAGPTGIGKSSFALDLAERINGEIVSCDSRLIYREMDIGTAKPSHEELRRVRHHCIDIIDPAEEYSAGKWAMDADTAIRDILSRGKRPILCGGTLFYASALRQGFDSTTTPDRQFREESIAREKSFGAGTLHADLQLLNPQRAEELHPHDLYRIIRALQIVRDGESISKPMESLNVAVVELQMDRAKLYERINARVDIMVQSGLFEEFQKLLEKGYNSTSPGLKSVGYFEFFNYIETRCSFKDSIERIKQNSRNYAKKQLTWLKNREKPSFQFDSSNIKSVEMLADSLGE